MKVCWNLTSKCNRNCKFCFREKNFSELSYDTCLTILDNLVKLDTTKINFAGGEPLLFEKLPELLKESKSRGIYNKLSTNCSLLNENNVNTILKNIDTIAISVDSSSDEENYFLGRGLQHYAHIKKMIPVIKKKFPNIKIEINTVLTSQTVNGLNELYDSITNDFKNGEIYRWKLIRFCQFRGIDSNTSNKFEITDEEFQNINKKFSNIEASILINVVDEIDMINKNVVNQNGILEYNKNNQKKHIDLKNNSISINGSLLKSGTEDNYINNMNLNLFKVFYEVARYGSLSLTSKRIMISQPAISKSIKQLEETLDENLFYRTINGMSLTPVGKKLFNYVEEAKNSIKTGIRSVMESTTSYKGKLYVGAPSHIASFYLYDKIKKLYSDYPQIEISIISRPTRDLIKKLENHELDLVIDASPIEGNEKVLQIDDLGEYEHCFVGLKKRNYSKGIKSIKDLENYPLILPVSQSSHRKKLNDVAYNNDTKFRNVISIETSEMMKELILQDVGIGYILKGVVKRKLEEGVLEEIKIAEKLPTMDLKLVYIDKYLTNIPRMFIENYLK